MWTTCQSPARIGRGSQTCPWPHKSARPSSTLKLTILRTLRLCTRASDAPAVHVALPDQQRYHDVAAEGLGAPQVLLDGHHNIHLQAQECELSPGGSEPWAHPWTGIRIPKTATACFQGGGRFRALSPGGYMNSMLVLGAGHIKVRMKIEDRYG